MPNKLNLIVSLMYGKRDPEGQILNRQNLKVYHQFDVNIEWILTLYNAKDTKTAARFLIKETISRLKEIVR